jgi:hypothetical protein
MWPEEETRKLSMTRSTACVEATQQTESNFHPSISLQGISADEIDK